MRWRIPTIMKALDQMEAGSLEWLTVKALFVQWRWDQESRDLESIREHLADLFKHSAWRVLPPEKPAGTAERLVEAIVGLDLDTVLGVISGGDAAIERDLRASIGEDAVSSVKRGGVNNPAGLGGKSGKRAEIDNKDNVLVDKDAFRKGSNDPSWHLRRIARIAAGEPTRKVDKSTGKWVEIETTPERATAAAEALERYRHGEVTPRGAAIELGLIEPPQPLQQMLRWWAKAPPDQRTAFLACVDASGRDRSG